MYKWLDRIASDEMEKAVTEFHNEYLRRELYLSDPVSAKLDKIRVALLEAVPYAIHHSEDDYSSLYEPEIRKLIGEERTQRRKRK